MISMDQITLKELTPYLPYRLTFQHQSIHDSLDIHSIYPLLRPLSDLTKEITHNGETFVPLNEIKALSVNIEYYENHIKPYLSPLTEFLITTKNHLPSWVTEKLCEWHFDVFGLIGRGLALPMEE